MWDETLLAYAERHRVLPEPYRKRVIVKAGDVLPTFTVDGYVAGLWWPEATGDETPHRVRAVRAPGAATATPSKRKGRRWHAHRVPRAGGLRSLPLHQAAGLTVVRPGAA